MKDSSTGACACRAIQYVNVHLNPFSPGNVIAEIASVSVAEFCVW